MRYAAAVLALVTLVVDVSAAAAADVTPADAVDEAASCLRRQRPACGLEAASRALTLLAGDPSLAGAASLRREALVMRAHSLALLDRGEDARQAFIDVLDAWPGYAPADDDDPRVSAAWQAATHASILQGLPSQLSPGPAPVPPLPSTDQLVGPLVLYAPDTLTALDPATPAQRRFSLSIGGGIGIPIGSSADRLDSGVHAAIDFSYVLFGNLSLWIETALALLSIDDSIPVEPGYSRGLTLFSAAIGVHYSLPLSEAFELVAGLALGYGAFGIRSSGEASGLSLHGCLGLRYNADANLALRLDLAPVGVAATTRDVGFGGHLAIIVRGETRF